VFLCFSKISDKYEILEWSADPESHLESLTRREVVPKAEYIVLLLQSIEANEPCLSWNIGCFNSAVAVCSGGWLTGNAAGYQVGAGGFIGRKN
jgi:hypothetical protein